MHRGRAELVLDVLVVIEPLDRVVEFGAFFFRKLGFHLADRLGELRAVQLLERGGDIRKHGQTLLGDFGKPAQHDDPFVRAAVGHGQDPGPDRGYDWRMSRQHAEVAFDAGNVDLIDLTGEGELFGRDEIKMEGSHLGSLLGSDHFSGKKRIASSE